MDPFAFVVMVGLGILVGALFLIGKFYPGTGADVLDWKPTRSPEVEAQNELDDVAQMLEAQNERRRRRGQAELTEEEINARVQEDREFMSDMAERWRQQGQRSRERIRRRRLQSGPGGGPAARRMAELDETDPSE